jgi:hypothetical protein
MKNICRLGVLLFLLWPILLFATDLKPMLLLERIEVQEAGENPMDELYFDISIYRPHQSAIYKRIPSLPTNWLSYMTPAIQRLPLWSDLLKEGEALTIILSLNDADSPPWDIDDVIGLVKIQIKNNQGRLQVIWGSGTMSPGVADKVQEFDIKGPNGHYYLHLTLKSQ